MRVPAPRRLVLSQYRASTEGDDSAATDVAFVDDELLLAQCDDNDAIECTMSNLASNARTILTRRGFDSTTSRGSLPSLCIW